MSDTMTVVAIAPSVGGTTVSPGYSFGGGFSSDANARQAMFAYYQSPNFAINCAKYISDYIDTHDLNDPKTLNVVSSNINTQCYADKVLVKFPDLGVYGAIHDTSQGAAGNYNYTRDQTTQLSGDLTTPITAWAHFLWGNGAERVVNLPDVGLRIQANQIAPVMSIVNSGAVGTFAVNSNFTRDTMLDGIVPASYLGNITMKTEGTLTIETSGAWRYDGVVRAYNDIYDANPSTHRGALGEWSTKVLRHFSGTPYPISMPGQVSVKGTGFR